MKEVIPHIAKPIVQRSSEPFFQRMAEEGRDNSAFFSSVQAKLSVGQKDDPFEKEADAVADKVVNRSPTEVQQQSGENTTVQNKVNYSADHAAAKIIQSKFESSDTEDKIDKKEDEGADIETEKKQVADESGGDIQRMCRECDEGDKVFRAEAGDPDISGMSKRDAVIAMAKTMLGKIKAKQPGGGGERYGAKELWEIFKLAAPGVWSEETVKTFGQQLPSWCGIFSVWAHKKAGIDLGNWQMGKGVTAFGTLKQTTSPQPGDIGYIDQPFQHHCIVTKVNGDTIESIDGNSGLYSEVIENTRPKTVFTGFFTAFSGSDGGVSKKDGDQPLQKKSDSNSNVAPPSVESSLSSSKGGGSGLSAETRVEMESGIGADFSNVRIHTDSSAVDMSKQLNAHAFTHGNDIYFNQGKFDTATNSGKHLLAHELTHTVQQGAARGVQKKTKTVNTSTGSNTINRKAIKAADVDITVEGNMYEITFKSSKKTHTIDLDSKTLEMPEIILPSLKERNEKLYKMPLLSVRGRGETFQVENWIAAVRSAVDAKVHAFLIADNPGLKDSDQVYYKLAKKKDFHLIGNIRKIQENSYIPKWNRYGEPNNHQVDHIVEYQLGGADQPGVKPENYELLDAQANMSSGNAIRQQRYDRINESLGYFTDINTEMPGKFPSLPSAEDVKKGYINKFGKITGWNLDFNGRGDVYWTYDELVQKAAHLKQLKKMTPDEVADVAGSAAEATIYVAEGSGSPKKLALPFAGKQVDFFKGMDLDVFTVNPGAPVVGTPAGSVEFSLNQKFTDRLKAGDKLKFSLMPIEGRLNTYYIKTTKGFNKNAFRKFEGLSPVTINEPEIDPDKGLMVTGTITCEVPLLKDLAIDFYIAGGEMGFSTVIDASIIKKYFPKPFNVSSVNLQISYLLSNSGDSGISLIGSIGFEIAKLGKGTVKGGKKGKGFILSGDFEFDKSLFDGELHFAYEDDKWSIGGSGTIDSKKLKAVKSAKLSFDYKDETLIVGGLAKLTVPGIKEIKIDSTIGKDGDFTITANIQLSDIPRIKGGEGTVTISKDKTGEWDLGITGKVKPDLDFKGLQVTEANVSYAKGAFDFHFDASYERNRITGGFQIGVTNKAVSADGTKADGEGTSKMVFYGALTLKVKVTDELVGEIKSVLKPDGDITLDGKIELNEDKKIFDVPPVNKNVFTLNNNIPLASCGVATLSLHIGGAVDLYANVDPLSIKKDSHISIGNLSLNHYDNPKINSKIMLGSKLSAGVRLALQVGLDASLIGILHAQVGGEGTLDFVAIEADATGIIDMGWSPEGGFKINEASVSLEMMSKLVAELKAYASVFVDLWLTTISIWEHKWPVAKEEFKLSFFEGGKLKIDIPVSDNKLGVPDVKGGLSEVEKSATPKKVEESTQNKLDGKNGQDEVDKRAEVNTVTQKEVLDAFKNPDRFDFNKSDNYLVTRYGLYDYLKGKAGLDEKIDLSYIDSEIEKCEFEEYLAFSEYILNDTSFDDYSKSVIIEDFITNHPTLGPTELINLRNVVTVKVPEKEPLKTRASQVPKKTSDQPVSKPQTPVQAKSMKATGESQLASGSDSAADADVVSEIAGLEDFESQEHTDIADPGSYISYSDDNAESCSLEDMGVFEQNNENTFNTDFMRSYSRTRRPLQQRADEKRKGSFFNGPDKKEKAPDGAFFQAKLNVGSVDDPQEKEADNVADKVMAQPPKGNDKKEGADKTATPKPAAEKKEEKPEVQKKSHETEKEEENKTVVKKKQNGTSNGAKGRSVEASITEKKGKGNQLPGSVLHDMESAFGSDFSGVNIHTDSEAAALSNDLDAHAFTSGKDIYFNFGKFDPNSESGRHLLAHELTHVIQQNGDTVQREPKKDKDPEKTRAQGVRDSYQKALKGKSVDWREVAMYFNAFNQPEMQTKKAQLTAQQQFLLHQGAVHGPGVGPWSAAALNTTPIPNMPDATAAGIEDKIIQSNYQQAINLMVDYLDGSGIIDRKLLWGGTFHYLAQDNLKGEGRVLAPGYDKDGKANPTASNIGTDAFGEDKGIPFLYSTIVHEYQHVQQMQKKDESKSAIPSQSGDDTTHLQQEVEAYGTELIHAKDTGLSNNPAQVEDTWFRLHMRWDQLDDVKKKDLKDIYANAYKVAKEAVGVKTKLPYTPLK